MPVLRLADAITQTILETVDDAIDGGSSAGTIKIYDGTIPTNADTAIGSQNLLATLTFSDPSKSSYASRTLTFASVTDESSATAGTASWARIADSNGNTIFDCDVTATGGGGTIELNSVAITGGGTVSITSFTATIPAA